MNPSRTVPIALRNKLKSELYRMEKSDVILKVDTNLGLSMAGEVGSSVRKRLLISNCDGDN